MSAAKTLDPDVRALLWCPRCHADLRDAPRGLVCDACAVLWPVVDGVPQLVDACARPVGEAEDPCR